MALEITEKFLENLMDEVKKELDGLTKSEVAKLVKSDEDKEAELTAGDSESEGMDSVDAPAPDNNNDGKIGDLDGKPEAPNDVSNAASVEDKPEVEASKEAVANEELSKPMDEQTPGEISPAPSIEALQAEYEELDDDDLHNHYLACKGAILARMGADEESAEDEEMLEAPEAPEAAPAMDAAPPEAAPAPAMEKADLPMSPSPEPKEPLKAPAAVPVPVMKAEMKKSEAAIEIELLKSQLAEAQARSSKQEEAMTKLVDTLQTPMRKSIRGVSELAFIPKSEMTNNAPKLSKDKAIEKLREKARSEDLKKSDRSLINSYCMGNVKYEDIAHLLTDVK